MKLNPLAFGAALALLLGVAVFGATYLSVELGKGQTLKALSAPFRGYTVSKTGAWIGLGWGLGYGFALGLVWATIYNVFAGIFGGKKS